MMMRWWGPDGGVQIVTRLESMVYALNPSSEHLYRFGSG